MLHFVWTDPAPLYSGRGGTETYTIGHVQELLSRGIPARIVTYGHGKKDGRQFHPGIPFHDIQSLSELSDMDGTIVFINLPHDIPTKKKPFVIYHLPPFEGHGTQAQFIQWTRGKKVLVNSYFLRNQLVDFLHIPAEEMTVVHPFSDPTFGQVKRPRRALGTKTRVLFAGRLHPEKGIYIFWESLHHKPLWEGFEFSVTTAGNQTAEGQLIESIARAHPLMKVVDAEHEREGMAALFARHDIVVMPSNHQYWHEGFGMVSVEAQHSGCRVVASNDGGLPETDCGLLTLVEPGHSLELAKGIKAAADAGPASLLARKKAVKHFTRATSVDTLLAAVAAEDVHSLQVKIPKSKSTPRWYSSSEGAAIL